MPVLPPNAIQGEDADRAQVANVIDDEALGASLALPSPPTEIPPLPVDALAAAASAPPPVAGDAVDAAVAPMLPPQGGPALSLVPPPPPEAIAPPATPAEAAQRNVTKAEELGAEQVANATEKAGLDQQKADAKKARAVEREKALSALVERQELHRHAAEARTAEARSKAESEPFHTFWETRSIGQDIVTGIGLILGGVSWNPNHVNRGVQLLQSAIEQDFALQKAKHADLWRAVEAAEKGESTLDASQLREVSRFNAVEAAKHDAVASRLSAAAAMNKGKGDVSQAKKTALEESEKANTFWQLAAHAEAGAAHQKEIDAESARHHAEQEKTAALRASKYKTKGGGTGGGGSSPALAELAAMASRGASAEEMLKYGGLKHVPKLLQTVKTIRDEYAKEKKQEGLDLTRSDKDETRLVRDPETNQPYAKANTAKAATKFATDDVNYADAATRMQQLADDINLHGKKVTSPEDVARRITKFANAVIAVGIVSPLGKTNETLHLETDSIGIPGGLDPRHLQDSIRQLVTTQGANLEAVQHKVEEIKHKRQAFRNTLTPLSNDERKKFSGGGGGRPPGSKAGFISDGRAVWQYPDKSIHLEDGSEVTKL